MFNRAKKFLAAVLTAACVMTGAAEVFAAPSPTTAPTPVSTTVVRDNKTSLNKFQTNTNGEATLIDVWNTQKKTALIHSYVEKDGVKYTVTTVGANAFKNSKVSRVVLDSKVYKIKKNAFKGAKKVKYVYLRTTKKVSVKKGAFKGLNTKKMVVKINKKNKNYKKIVTALRKAGFKGKIGKYTYKKK